MNFARALTSPKVCAGGQVFEDEEWYVLDAEWGRACAPAVFAMQATAARINCCLYAADAADACTLLTAIQREGKISWNRPVMFAATNSQKSSVYWLYIVNILGH